MESGRQGIHSLEGTNTRAESYDPVSKAKIFRKYLWTGGNRLERASWEIAEVNSKKH